MKSLTGLEFKAIVENQTEKQIKVLRTDNGGEFCGNEFEEICKKCGISRKNTTPYTPQWNGVIERMNMVLMEKSRCMLNDARLGKELWAEVVGTACYLVNSHPHQCWMTRLHKRYELVRNVLSHISRYLDVRPMFMFKRGK